MGYQLSKHLFLQAGYVNQANYNYTASQGRFILQSTAAKNNVVVNLTFKILHRNAKAQPIEKLPSQPDGHFAPT